MKLLLLSNGKEPGMELYEHAQPWLAAHFAGCKRIMFVPYAKADMDGYAKDARAAFEPLGIEVVSAHERLNPGRSLDNLDGVFVGGGNTWRLFDSIWATGLNYAMRDSAREGKPCGGASAGSTLVCPTLATTNDMPIKKPRSWNGLNLLNFQINPHYPDNNRDGTAMGEQRQDRIKEFHEINDIPVLGLREGCALKTSEDGSIILLGNKSARLFTQGNEPVELESGILVPLQNQIDLHTAPPVPLSW